MIKDLTRKFYFKSCWLLATLLLKFNAIFQQRIYCLFSAYGYWHMDSGHRIRSSDTHWSSSFYSFSPNLHSVYVGLLIVRWTSIIYWRGGSEFRHLLVYSSFVSICTFDCDLKSCRNRFLSDFVPTVLGVTFYFGVLSPPCIPWPPSQSISPPQVAINNHN